MVLNSEPTDEVTVLVESNDENAATVSGTTLNPSSQLTFTVTNWRTAQTVTVTGEDDEVDNADGSRSVMIRHTPSGGDYDGIPASSVGVTVTDDDTADLTVTPELVTVSENRRTTSYQVALKDPPLRDVTVTVTSGDTDKAVVHENRSALFLDEPVARTLTFTTINGDRPSDGIRWRRG